jgi:hypothetical protein
MLASLRAAASDEHHQQQHQWFMGEPGIQLLAGIKANSIRPSTAHDIARAQQLPYQVKLIVNKAPQHVSLTHLQSG